MSRTSRQQGFTLIEVMLSMLLVFTTLGLIATLMREYTKVSKFASARDNTLDALQMALVEVTQELSEAVDVSYPENAGQPWVDSVAFSRIDPSVERWSQDPLGGFEESFVWNPRAPDEYITVVYSRDGLGTLNRASVGPDGSQNQAMASNLNRFQVLRLSQNRFRIALSFQEKNRLRVFTRDCRVWSKL